MKNLKAKMDLYVKKVIYFLIMGLTLVACATRYPSNGENQYLHSRNGKTLVIPAPLASADISHFYDLPHLKQNSSIPITPPTAS